MENSPTFLASFDRLTGNGSAKKPVLSTIPFQSWSLYVFAKGSILYQINGDVEDNGYSDDPRQYYEGTIEFLLGLWKERDPAVSTKD